MASLPLPRVESIDAVALYLSRRNLNEHDVATQSTVAHTIARLFDVPFQGLIERPPHPGESLYLIPTGTVVGLDRAHQLGIDDPSRLFGGVVPHAFVATKAITHPTLHIGAASPEGWSAAFGEAVMAATLPGYTVFTLDDAYEAFDRLVAQGPVRTKPVHGMAGRGQTVVTDRSELDRALAALDQSDLASCGLVLESHVEDVITYSVGHVVVNGLSASYVGTQCLTDDIRGEAVYGGSSLLVARGGFDALLGLTLSDVQRQAVEQARIYDAAALSCFEGLMASRRNYDTVTGTLADGQPCAGVLEQSWRIGGASPAEVAALEAFADDPTCQAVRADTVERYGPDAKAPDGAIVSFDKVDPQVGKLLKYATVERI